jgi:hypothetical protein
MGNNSDVVVPGLLVAFLVVSLIVMWVRLLVRTMKSSQK